MTLVRCESTNMFAHGKIDATYGTKFVTTKQDAEDLKRGNLIDPEFVELSEDEVKEYHAAAEAEREAKQAPGPSENKMAAPAANKTGAPAAPARKR